MGKLLTTLTLSVLVSLLCQANPDTLIRKNDYWKYLDNGSNQDTAWRYRNFVDTTWTYGFAQFGYGEGDEATVVNYGPSSSNKYVTTYFRREISITTPSVWCGLRAIMTRDDGAVIYINGHEAYRSNMPEGEIKYDTYAAYRVTSGQERYPVVARINSSMLIPGINQIAVEIHRFAANGSDLSFDMTLVADPDPVIVMGPYLQNAFPGSMTICYRTSCNGPTKVYYGTSMSYTDSMTSGASSDHFVMLMGLQPGTKYYYAIEQGGSVLAGDSTTFFYTAPDTMSRQPVRIWAMSDMGNGSTDQEAIRDAYYAYAGTKYTDIMLWGGDNAYPAGRDENFATYVFNNAYEQIAKQSVIYSAIGNHEWMSANSNTQSGAYFDIFDFPKHGESGGFPSGTEAYYSFNYSNIHFVSLESNVDDAGAPLINSMLNWLHNDLSSNTLPWIIVIYHLPPYSKGYHNSDSNTDMIFMRENVNPILEAYNVDLVLSGHSHTYERSCMMKGHFGYSSSFVNSMFVDSTQGRQPYYTKVSSLDSGTVYAVIGASGDLAPVQSDWPHPAMCSYSSSNNGSMVIDVNGDTLHAIFLTSDTTIADEFTILKNITTGVRSIPGVESSFLLYPDPAGSQLNVRLLNNKGAFTIKIYSMSGREVMTQKFDGLLAQMNVSDLPAGTYLVTMESGHGIGRKLFIKE